MSWSLHAEGTKEAVKRSLAAQKIYGTPTEEEQAVFATVQTSLINIVDFAQETEGTLTIVRASAGGHGPNVSGMQLETRIVQK